MTFDPISVEVTCVTLPKDHCVQVHENTSKYVDTVTIFAKKNMNQRSLIPRWPLTPHLLRSHVWLYPRIIVSKAHGNTSMYVDTVITFANYHIHTHTYYVRTTYRISDHIVSFWTTFRRDKNDRVMQLLTHACHEVPGLSPGPQDVHWGCYLHPPFLPPLQDFFPHLPHNSLVSVRVRRSLLNHCNKLRWRLQKCLKITLL